VQGGGGFSPAKTIKIILGSLDSINVTFALALLLTLLNAYRARREGKCKLVDRCAVISSHGELAWMVSNAVYINKTFELVQRFTLDTLPSTQLRKLY